MILLFMIVVLWNRTQSQCSVDGANALCQADYNIAECDWDNGDCCEATCKDTYKNYVCGGNTPFDCKNPSFDPTEATLSPTPSPTCTVVANDSQSVVGNARCDDEFNNAACQYDGGDCCSASCNDTFVNRHCGSSGFDCKDPDYVTPSPTEFYISLVGISGGDYKDISANAICVDHPHDFDAFLPVGNWELSDGNAVTFNNSGYLDSFSNEYEYSDYYEYCLVNYTKSSCEAQEFVAKDNLHIMTYCCALDLWIIGAIPGEGGAPLFKWYATSTTGGISGLTTWHGDAPYGWYGANYTTFESVYIFEGGCETAGLIIVIVLLVIFIGLLIWFCYKFGIRDCGSILDAFEKQAARIELVIIGICFGDSFISSVFITIPLPISILSKGIVVMFFTFISLTLFGVRMYISKAHILESECIGSLADFTFDLGLGILLVFLYSSISTSMAEGFNFFVFLILLGTYAGIAEEFLQLLSHIKNERLQKAIACYLGQSGRVLATINMFLLFVYSISIVTPDEDEPDNDLPKGWAYFLIIWSACMFCATSYSWYAYVGCFGRGGHKKPKESDEEGDDKGDEETGDATGDKAEDGGEDKAEDDKGGDEETGHAIGDDGGENKAEDGRVESNI